MPVTSTATIDVGIFCNPTESVYKWQFAARKIGSGGPAFTLMTPGCNVMFFNVTEEHLGFLTEMLADVKRQLFQEAPTVMPPVPDHIRETCRRAHGMIHRRLEGMSIGTVAEVEYVERLLMEIVKPQAEAILHFASRGERACGATVGDMTIWTDQVTCPECRKPQGLVDKT